MLCQEMRDGQVKLFLESGTATQHQRGLWFIGQTKNCGQGNSVGAGYAQFFTAGFGLI
jgi:hypothetical protein